MIARLGNARRGAAGLIVAAAMPVLIGATALAVDLGSAMLETRQLQGAADAAALAAAGDPSRADGLAGIEVSATHWPGTVTTTTVAGNYNGNAGIPPADRFVAGGAPANAVRVTLNTPAPTYFARIFGFRSIPLARTATAAQINLASFSLGSRLAALNGGIVNSYLSALTGSSLSLSVNDYNSLAGADVDLFGFIDALKTQASISAGSYDSALDAQVTSGQVLAAAASAAQADGNISAAAALRLLGAQAASRNLSLNSLIDPGMLGQQDSGGEGFAKINILDLVTGALQLGSPTRQVALDLGAGIPGLVATKVTVAIGERPENSPLIAVSSDGMPILRTAQTRIYAETSIGGVALPGLGSLVSIKLPIFVELASAEARLNTIDCSSDAGRGVTIDARPGLGELAIASIDTSKLDDFTQAMPLSQATLIHALLIDVTGNARVDLGAAEPWQPVFFNAAQVAAGSIQTVSSGSAVQGLSQSLLQTLHLDGSIELGGLVPIKLPISQVLKNAVGSQLALAAPALDSLIDLVTGTIGVHYGQADVRVTGMRCGTPALVG